MKDPAHVLSDAIELAMRADSAAPAVLHVLRAERAGAPRQSVHDALARGETPDPTADAALRRDPAREALERFLQLVKVLHDAANDLLALCEQWSVPPGFCHPCYTHGVRTAVTLRPSGEPYFRGLCRWHGNRRGLGQEPTREEVWNRYRRAG